MRAVIITGHGSVRPGAGAAMIRLTARIREMGIASLVAAGFLNYSRPTFTTAFTHVVAQGAKEVVIAPYFLTPGKFVNHDLPLACAASQALYPALQLILAQPFGDHSALAELVLKRARHMIIPPTQDVALLIVAHGSPLSQANRPIYAVAQRIRAMGDFACVRVCFLGLNQPDIWTAIAQLDRQGLYRCVIVPYFLHKGNHVTIDLPAIVTTAKERYPCSDIRLTEHLAYDPLLAAVISDRVRETKNLASLG